MRFHEFDTVVLKADMPSHGLNTGDVGAVPSGPTNPPSEVLPRRPLRQWVLSLPHASRLGRVSSRTTDTEAGSLDDLLGHS